MPQSPFAPAESARGRWQFSIRGILLFTASVAIGASVSQINLSSWMAFVSLDVYNEWRVPTDIKTGFFGGSIAVLLFWCCFGLFYQVRDLRAWLAAHGSLPGEQRAGARFEIGWRICLLASFLLYAVMVYLVDQKRLVLAERGVRFWNVAEMIREAIFALLLLILVGSVPAARPRKYWAALVYLVRAVLGVCIIRFFLEYVLDDMAVCRLVEIATIGISNAFPLDLTPNGAILVRRYSRIFFWWTAASGVVFAFNYYFLSKLARQKKAGIGRRLLWCVLLSLGVLNTSVFAIWILTYGYPQLSPIFVEARGPIEFHCWIAIAVITVLLAAVSAYRMTADRRKIESAVAAAWRRNPDNYYHEWRLVLWLFAMAVAGLLAQLLYYQSTVPGLTLSNLQTFGYKRPPGFSLNLIPDWLNGRPVNYLWLALILLALHRALWPRGKGEQRQTELPRIELRRFFAIWLLSLLVILPGLFALAWLSFAVWYSPWYMGR